MTMLDSYWHARYVKRYYGYYTVHRNKPKLDCCHGMHVVLDLIKEITGDVRERYKNRDPGYYPRMVKMNQSRISPSCGPKAILTVKSSGSMARRGPKVYHRPDNRVPLPQVWQLGGVLLLLEDDAELATST